MGLSHGPSLNRNHEEVSVVDVSGGRGALGLYDLCILANISGRIEGSGIERCSRSHGADTLSVSFRVTWGLVGRGGGGARDSAPTEERTACASWG